MRDYTVYVITRFSCAMYAVKDLYSKATDDDPIFKTREAASVVAIAMNKAYQAGIDDIKSGRVIV